MSKMEMTWRDGLRLKTMDYGKLTWAGNGLTCLFHSMLFSPMVSQWRTQFSNGDRLDLIYIRMVETFQPCGGTGNLSRCLFAPQQEGRST
jgi:hypothetical protein